MCVSSKWHQLREDHSVKYLNWRLPPDVLKTGKTLPNCQQLPDWSETSEKLTKKWEKDSPLKTFKKGMPIWKSKVSSHGKGTLHRYANGRWTCKVLVFQLKASKLVKKKCPDEDVLEYLDVFVDVIEYLFEEKLRQLKSHQQHYWEIPCKVFTRVQKEELSHLKSSFNQRHGVMKQSWRSGLKRIGITFSANHQLIDPPAKLFM